MKRLLLKAVTASALLGLAAGTAFANSDGMATNPYAPSYGHHYRHGAVPTRATWAHMKQWRSRHASTAATGTNTLYYRGGTSSSSQGNVGVMNGVTKVYLVFYGSGWGSQSTNANGDAVFSGDPDHAAEAAQEMFKGIGTGGETWSADLTQWCQGISSGASSCPSGTPSTDYVPYQSNGSAGILAGVWEDTSATSPINATSAQLGQEAVKAAAHFGNTTAASNRHAYYVIMSAHGDNPDNYQSPTQGYCAWHDWNGDVGVTSSYGDIAFSNQPYNMDLGSSCGVGFVNSPGTLDGWTMTLGHEWHEMVSDQFPAGGWTASSGQENSDECAWLSSGQGASANVTFTTGTFAEQSSWSNDTNECDLSHAILTHGGGNTTPTANNGSVTTSQDTAVNGTLSASDSDGDSLTFAVVTNPSHGSVSITNSATGAFTYTPNSGYSGSDSFTFNATDSAGNVSNTATESVTVNATNTTPVASNGSVTTNQDTAVNGTLSASDSDGDSLTFAVVANPSHGSVSITNSSTGAFTYTPNSGYSGSDSFTFHATDSAGNVSNTATESVTVNGTTNSAPVASNGSVTTNENQAVSGTLSASDSDGDSLTFAVVANPSHGSVSITNSSTGAFTYTPASNYSGSDSFTFKATDSAGNVSNTATESVTVNPVSTGGCSAGYTKYTGSVSAGSDVYEPNGNYYYAGSGYERGNLTGPTNADFDLYLYKWNSYYGWMVVSSSTSNTSNESISYNGSSGYYIWDIYGYAGSGNFTFCLQHP